MKQLDLQQGSGEWHAHRATARNASEAPIIMGKSPYVKRADFIRQKALGLRNEVTPAQEALFHRGHEIEAFCRPLAEVHICEDLYPITATSDDGYLSASFDGITISEDTIWECKSSNADLRAALDAGDLPDSHWPQVEQQFLVSGAQRAIFTISDGTPEGTRHLEYLPRPDRQKALLAAWKQFDEDLANSHHVEVIPVATVAPIEDLPALVVEITGQVTSSNLVSFQGAVMARIQAINTDLQTDEDFAIAEKTVTFLDDGEKRLDLVKSQALAQTASIDELFRTIDALKGEMKAKRLTLDKLVKARKDSIRVEIMQGGKDAITEHIAALNKRLGKPYMPPVIADFAAVMKGKRTIASLRDAVSTELSRVKIEANELADNIQINLGTLRDLAKDHAFLFADTAQIVLKAPDDLAALVKLRIAEHQAAEAKRREDERARIRAEEEAKAAAKVKAEQEEAARQQRGREEAEARAQRQSQESTAQSAAAATPAAPQVEGQPIAPTAAPIDESPVTRTRQLLAKINAELDLMTDFELAEVINAIARIHKKRKVA